ncbi:hypothetical protein RDWZM_004420 [Blomia tropicalis]|uniref:Uncharacterized protein n=1 Tax=Blomia tropicalis TaxID=40697 RepID=A0A9Q0ML45_BLOTA|nr:hypothetical protein RDWZM_004420 [Blomia tropicalis]
MNNNNHKSVSSLSSISASLDSINVDDLESEECCSNVSVQEMSLCSHVQSFSSSLIGDGDDDEDELELESDEQSISEHESEDEEENNSKPIDGDDDYDDGKNVESTRMEKNVSETGRRQGQMKRGPNGNGNSNRKIGNHYRRPNNGNQTNRNDPKRQSGQWSTFVCNWGHRSNLIDQNGNFQRATTDLKNYIAYYKAKYYFYFDLVNGRYPQFVRKFPNNFEIWRMSFNVYASGFSEYIAHLGEIHAFYQMELVDIDGKRELRWLYKDFNFYPNKMRYGFKVNSYDIADVHSRFIKFISLRDSIIKQFPYVNIKHKMFIFRKFDENHRTMMNRLSIVKPSIGDKAPDESTNDEVAEMSQHDNSTHEAIHSIDGDARMSSGDNGGGGGGGGSGGVSEYKREHNAIVDRANNNRHTSNRIKMFGNGSYLFGRHHQTHNTINNYHRIGMNNGNRVDGNNRRRVHHSSGHNSNYRN